ncbi:MAG: hypothetical protein ACREDV_09510 [Methylocella sp.]
MAALTAFRRRAIHLQRGVINVSAKKNFDGFQVATEATARQLYPIGKTPRRVVNKPLGALTIAGTLEMRNKQLGVGIDRRPRPIAAGAIDGLFHGRDAFCLSRRGNSSLHQFERATPPARTFRSAKQKNSLT